MSDLKVQRLEKAFKLARNAAAGLTNHCENNGSTRRFSKELQEADRVYREALFTGQGKEVPASQAPNNTNLSEPGGMALRDYFAAKLAPEIMRQFYEDGTPAKYSDWRQGIAVEAYRIADAMLDFRGP